MHLHTMAMTHRPSLCTESFRHGNIICRCRQSLVSDEPHSSVFVGKIRPNHVVENVSFYCVDYVWQSSESLRACFLREGCSVDHEAREMIKMCMGDEVRGYKFAEDV